MAENAGFLPAPAAPQWMETFAGWTDGDNSFTGPSHPTDAEIPYYQKTRHIFGDLKIEILDAQGNLVDTIATSKHRGVNRTTWSMHTKPPHVPPAASLLGGAAVGPRVVPGTYTVKMTKGDEIYTTTLTVTLDPRATYTTEDRKAQFDLVNRLATLLNHMSWGVDAIIAVRDESLARAAKLPANDPVRKQAERLASDVDQIRLKIVATKEGGMITGEERLREFLGGLYGDVSGYEGRPTDSQVARTDALAHELDDVINQFGNLTSKQLLTLNRGLETKQLGSIHVISEEEWRKTNLTGGGGIAPPSTEQLRRLAGVRWGSMF
jgi:hypothetical protein